MKNIFLFLIIFISGSVFSQDFSMIDEIKKQMSAAEQEELTNTQEIIKEGDDLIESGEKLLLQSETYQKNAESLSGSKKKKSLKSAESTKTKAYTKLVEGQVKYEEANKIIYTLYKKNLKTLKENTQEKDKVSQIEELEQEANNYFIQATAARNKAKKQKENELIYTLAVDAEQLETDAISIQIQAYSIFYGWFEPDENEVVENVEDNIKVEEIKISETKKDSVPPVKTAEPKIVFRIQIAASTVQLSMSKLQLIYPSSELIYADIDGEWYKYLVGNYKSYEAAYTAKSKMGVPGAFIVAYKDNIRVKNITDVCTPSAHPANDK